MIDEKALNKLLHWINERDNIRVRRFNLKMPKPWTGDKILQQYRFCNVRRMDDKVSDWLMKNWYKPNFNHPNSLVACAVARFINLPSSLAVMGYPLRWDPKRFKKKLRAHRDAGNTIFNGAYMVRGMEGEDKLESVFNFYVAPLLDPNLDQFFNPGSSMENLYINLLPKYGMGSFMAGQIVADMRWASAGAWEDRMTWAPPGPGSTRGLNRLHNRPIKTPIKYKQFQLELQEVIQRCRLALPSWITDRLEAHDYQNCLCEADKYMRALNGEGRPKSTYPGLWHV